MRRRRRLWSQAKVRSTTQRWRPETGAVLGLAAGDHGLDAALPDQPPVLVVVVTRSAISVRGLRRGRPMRPRTGGTRSSSWVTSLRVAAGETPGQRGAAAVYEQVVLAAATAPVAHARRPMSAGPQRVTLLLPPTRQLQCSHGKMQNRDCGQSSPLEARRYLMNQSTRARLEASDCSPDARGLSRSDGDCFESKLAGRPRERA
jgi:hypothetical protein